MIVDNGLKIINKILKEEGLRIMFEENEELGLIMLNSKIVRGR